jgi:hypothetical protein
MTEGLVLLHFLRGADEDVVTIRSYCNAIMCKITTEPHGPMQRWHEG